MLLLPFLLLINNVVVLLNVLSVPTFNMSDESSVDDLVPDDAGDVLMSVTMFLILSRLFFIWEVSDPVIIVISASVSVNRVSI